MWERGGCASREHPPLAQLTHTSASDLYVLKMLQMQEVTASPSHLLHSFSTGCRASPTENMMLEACPSHLRLFEFGYFCTTDKRNLKTGKRDRVMFYMNTAISGYFIKFPSMNYDKWLVLPGGSSWLYMRQVGGHLEQVPRLCTALMEYLTASCQAVFCHPTEGRNHIFSSFYPHHIEVPQSRCFINIYLVNEKNPGPKAVL